MSNLNIANTTVNSGNLNGGRDERDSEPTGNSGFNGRGVRTESSQGKSRKRPRDEGTKIRENKRVKVSRDRKVEKGAQGDFSRYVTEAEKNEILGKRREAVELYLKAIALDPDRYFD